jgi:cytoskeletal protein CcmA (bactofilin family)
MAAGGNINLSGNISDDAKIAGGVITVNGRIEDDLMISGSQIILGDSSEIGGDLVSGGGVLILDGIVYGEAILSGDNITIDGKINGNVKIDNVHELTITDNAEIKGDVIYSSTRKANISDDAKIDGEVKATITEKAEETKIFKDKGTLASIFSMVHFGGKVISFISLFLLGILLLLGLPGVFNKFNDRLRTTTGICVGAGAAALFGVPVAILIVFIISVLLFFTIIGAGAGIIAILANIILIIIYMLLIYLSTIFLSFFTGSMIFYKTNLNKSNYGWKVLFYFVGLIIVLILYNIPFIGWLCHTAGAIFGLGGLVMVIKDRLVGFKK